MPSFDGHIPFCKGTVEALIIRIGFPLKGSFKGFYKGSIVGFYIRCPNHWNRGFGAHYTVMKVRNPKKV